MEGRGCRDNWEYEQDWEKKGNRKYGKPCKAEEQEIVENKARDKRKKTKRVADMKHREVFLIYYM